MFLIKGGVVVNHDGRKELDVRINDGLISEIGHDLEAKEGEEVINAAGKFILPGAIDVHVHMRDLGASHKEDYKTGTTAAIHGGVTTVFEMPNSNPPTIDQESLELKLKAVDERAICDMKVYVGATPDNLDILPELTKHPRVAGIKAYLGSSTGNLLFDNKDLWDRLLSENKDTLVAVHAECECMINQNTEKFKDIHDPEIHSVIRGNDVAEAATRKIIEVGFKHNARLHIAHMSTKEELFAVKEYKEKGYTNLSCEVCPHHLFFTTNDYDKLSTYLRVNPPVRSKEDRNALWEDGIALGVVDIYATDHAPHTVEEKEQDYWKAPSGMPAVQEAGVLLMSKVHEGELSLEKFVELRSFKPAEIYRLEDRGYIKEGLRADIAIWDIEKPFKITKDWLKSKCGWSNYEGFDCFGEVQHVFVEGEKVL
jgi:dihydroorotase